MVLSGVLALVTALLFTDVGSAMGSVIVARIRDFLFWIQGSSRDARGRKAAMINFRYHIVSLMAVFLALSVGIAVGVSLGPSVDQGLLRQAEQDRKQVAELRNEINRRNALEEYRRAYDEQAGEPVIDGALRDVRVAVVTMPDAPGRVVTDLIAAVARAGGTVVREVEVRPDAFDPARSEALTEALAGLADQIPLTEDMTQAEKVGVALAAPWPRPSPRPATRSPSPWTRR